MIDHSLLKKLIIVGLTIYCYSAHGQVKTTPCDSIGTASGVCWSWIAPTSATPAATYSLYQIPMSGSSCAQFTPSPSSMVASAITNTKYIQQAVPTQSVCSEVTAVSAAGVEGAASVVATFLVQAPPGAPTGLQTVGKP